MALWQPGDVVEVEGALQRRFWRTPTGTAVTYEVNCRRGRKVHRATPRTWPSIRFSRFRQDDLISLRMINIYPPRVSRSRGNTWRRQRDRITTTMQLYGTLTSIRLHATAKTLSPLPSIPSAA